MDCPILPPGEDIDGGPRIGCRRVLLRRSYAGVRPSWISIACGFMTAVLEKSCSGRRRGAGLSRNSKDLRSARRGVGRPFRLLILLSAISSGILSAGGASKGLTHRGPDRRAIRMLALGLRRLHRLGGNDIERCDGAILVAGWLHTAIGRPAPGRNRSSVPSSPRGRDASAALRRRRRVADPVRPAHPLAGPVVNLDPEGAAEAPVPTRPVRRLRERDTRRSARRRFPAPRRARPLGSRRDARPAPVRGRHGRGMRHTRGKPAVWRVLAMLPAPTGRGAVATAVEDAVKGPDGRPTEDGGGGSDRRGRQHEAGAPRPGAGHARSPGNRDRVPQAKPRTIRAPARRRPGLGPWIRRGLDRDADRIERHPGGTARRAGRDWHRAGRPRQCRPGTDRRSRPAIRPRRRPARARSGRACAKRRRGGCRRPAAASAPPASRPPTPDRGALSAAAPDEADGERPVPPERARGISAATGLPSGRRPGWRVGGVRRSSPGDIGGRAGIAPTGWVARGAKMALDVPDLRRPLHSGEACDAVSRAGVSARDASPGRPRGRRPPDGHARPRRRRRDRGP